MTDNDTKNVIFSLIVVYIFLVLKHGNEDNFNDYT